MKKSSDAMIVVGVLALWWWLKSRVSGELEPEQLTADMLTRPTRLQRGPVVPFTPGVYIPIGGGLNNPQPETSWFSSMVSNVQSGVGSLLGIARGIRNNNPLNIANNPANPWLGLVADGTDKTYAQFTEAKYGIRAAGKVLDTYRQNGFDTIEKIITRWAPPKDNNTAGYIADITQKTGFSAGYRPTRADYPALVAAMIVHENSINPYSVAYIDEALRMA